MKRGQSFNKALRSVSNDVLGFLNGYALSHAYGTN